MLHDRSNKTQVSSLAPSSNEDISNGTNPGRNYNRWPDLILIPRNTSCIPTFHSPSGFLWYPQPLAKLQKWNACVRMKLWCFHPSISLVSFQDELPPEPPEWGALNNYTWPLWPHSGPQTTAALLRKKAKHNQHVMAIEGRCIQFLIRFSAEISLLNSFSDGEHSLIALALLDLALFLGKPMTVCSSPLGLPRCSTPVGSLILQPRKRMVFDHGQGNTFRV